jgi:hypothetical protein
MDGPLSFLESWKSFLPEGAVVMAKRGTLASRAESNPSLSATPVKHYKIAFQSPDLGAPGARELFDKIVAALELRAGEFTTDENSESFSSDVLVKFISGEKDPAGAWQKNSLAGAMTDTLTTYSLTTMLTNPGLK